MSSERSQVLALLAARRIDIAEAERLLAVVGGRDRFLALVLTLALWAVVLSIAPSANLSQVHLGNGILAALRFAFQSVSGSEAFHHLHTFLYRFLGELP